MSGPDLRSAEQFLPDQIPSLHARAADRVGTSVSPTCEVTAPMSVESTTLERSALERKDREELTTIAQALGVKPPSRARKAEIVQLILELTGVEPGGGGATAGGEANGPEEATVDDDADTPTPHAAAPEPAAEPAPAPAPAPAAESRGDEPLSEWETEFGGTTDVVDVPAPAGDNGSANGRTGELRTGEARPPQDDGAPTADGEARQGAGNGRPGDDPNEPGNRRRRRRGRRGKEETAPHTEDFAGEPVEVEGLLDLRDEGYGFLRVKGYLPSKDDTYVSVKQARQFGLRKGDHIKGASR